MGDINTDGALIAADMDALHLAISYGSDDTAFDLNLDETVDRDDVDFLINQVMTTERGEPKVDVTSTFRFPSTVQ